MVGPDVYDLDGDGDGTACQSTDRAGEAAALRGVVGCLGTPDMRTIAEPAANAASEGTSQMAGFASPRVTYTAAQVTITRRR